MANQVDEFKYFSYLIIFVLLIYMFILSVFLCVRRNEIRKERDLGLLPYNDDINNEYCAAYRINLTTKFEQIVLCSLGSSITYRIVLMCVRLVLFLYFFIVGAILNGVEKSYAFNYFENWCALLVMMYFLFATTCSIISIHTERSRTEVERRLNAVSAWTLKVRVLGVCTHLMFEVAGGTSVFVLVMVHFIHGPASEIINAVHYMTFFALLLEMWLNTVRVRFDQYPACAAWLVFYLLVIWPCVFTGVFLTWPYSEMTTQDINCFRNYFVLFLLNFVFYSCWYVLYKMKKLAFVWKDRYYDNRSSVGGSSIGDDSASVASSARDSVYSASWFDNGDDWAYPMATVTTTASTTGGPAVNRSLNLQPMGYRSGGGGSGAGGMSVASSTVGDSQYYESHNNYGGGSNNNRSNVNRTLNLQPMGARQSSTSSTDYYGGGGDAYSTQDHHHPPAGGSGSTSYNFWNSSGPVRPPVQHNRGLNINPISSYHHTSGNAQRTSVSDNSSDNSFGFFGAGATNDGYYDGQTPPHQQAPVPPAAAEAGYGGDDYYYGGYPSGTPVQRTGTYASPPPPPAAPTGGSSSNGGYDDYYYTNTSHAHNRGLNINPLSSYHRSSDPPPAPPAPVPVSSGGTWRGYAIGGGNRTSNPTTTSSAGSGIRFPAYSNKPRTNQVDRSLNLNPINQYHQRNTNPNNMSRQFSNTDNDLNAFADFGDDDGAYDVNVG